MSSEHLLKSSSFKHVYGDCRSDTLPMKAYTLRPAKMEVFRIWDGLTARCVRAITGTHGSTEATSEHTVTRFRGIF
jgi:hypothetical protein